MRRVKRSVMSMNITNDPLSGAEIAARGPGDYHLQCVVAMMSYENVITPSLFTGTNSNDYFTAIVVSADTTLSTNVYKSQRFRVSAHASVTSS